MTNPSRIHDLREQSELANRRQFRSFTLILAAPYVAFLVANALFVSDWMANPHALLRLIRPVYSFNTMAFPVLLLLSVTAFQVLSTDRFKTRRLRKVSTFSLFMVISIAILRIYATHIEPYQLTVRTITLPTVKLDRPLTLLHISDIQSEKVGNYEASVFNRIRELNPDLIIHTGDLLQPPSAAEWETEFTKIAALFQSLSPSLGIWTVIGNTDDYSDEQFRNGVGGMKILDVSDAVIPWGNSRICLYGLAVHEPLWENKIQVVSWLSDKTSTDFTILLGHDPAFILQADDLSIDLCLAGHTHGGQIRIPGLGPLTVLCPIPLEWGRGFHRIGKTCLNVSAGIGCEHAHNMPPIRLFCPPEMTLIRIVPELETHGSSTVESAAGAEGDVAGADQSVR